MDRDFEHTGTQLYSSLIHKSRYARWLDDKGRRETWAETVDRYINFFVNKFPHLEEEIRGLRSYIYDCKTMPSMRAVMTAGPALEKSNVAGYNCSYLPIDHPRAFDELFYILLNGTGVGFSVERQYVNKLPEVPDQLFDTDTVLVVADSKLGWAKSLKELISLLYAGHIPSWDTSRVRPAGSRLKTFGGRASGPQALIDLFEFTVNTFKKSVGRKLTSIECHDLCCKIAEVTVCGGVRRCLPKGTLVNMKAGVKRIEDIVVGDEVFVNGTAAKVAATEYTGSQQTLVLNHKYGKLECTENHRVAIFDRNDGRKIIFVPASGVVVGDRLVWDSAGFPGAETELPAVTGSYHSNCTRMTIPSLTEDVAWLIGVIHGNGSVSSRSIEITQVTSQISVLERARDVFNLFGLHGEISQGHGDCLRLRVSSTIAATYFSQHVKQSNTPIVIPEWISNSTQDIRWAYLAGVFDTDGRTRSDNVLEQVTTVYDSYARGIVHLLSGLGVGVSTHFVDRTKGRESGANVSDAITVAISGYSNRLKWITNITSRSVSGKLANSTVNVGNPNDFSFTANMLRNPKGYKNNGSVSLRAALEKGLVTDSILCPTPITSIDRNEEYTDTYDIEVSDVNMFTVSGVVVHNSALLSLSNPSDDRMRSAKSGQWWVKDGQRAMANNSACYTEKPEFTTFLAEWVSLYESKSGERGFFSRKAAKNKAASNGRRKADYEFGVNPCCFVYDTQLLTAGGYRSIGDLAKLESFDIVNKDGKVTRGRAWKADTKSVVTITFKDDFQKSITCTPDHPFMLVDGSTCLAENLVGKTLMPFTGSNADMTQVSSVIPAGVADVYDFNEPETNWGVVEGVIAHNSEIILRPFGFCNLTEVILRPTDTLDDIKQKVVVATILGTFQATLTDFKYLRPIWKKNADEEALLGVSMTGIEDHTLLNDPDNPDLPEILTVLKNIAIETNKEWAQKLGINQAAAVTTLKPSGSVSQLCNTSSGIHPRFSKYYIRRVRADVKDPLAQFMKSAGFPCEDDVTNKSNLIFNFPIKSPEGSVTVKDVGALHQLKLWKIYQDYWCEHKPSCTTYYSDDEFMEIGSWLWKNFDEVSGISFLPKSDHIYRQAPYEEITEAQYNELVKITPDSIDWEALALYEQDDNTTGSQELACSAGVCEIVDLVK